MGGMLSFQLPARHAGEVSDLPTLIRERIAQGSTLEALEAASGGVVKANRWSTLSRGEKLNQFPELQTLRGVAKALGITEAAVVLATARGLGLDMGQRGPLLGERIPSTADNLPLAVQSAIVNLVANISDQWPSGGE